MSRTKDALLERFGTEGPHRDPTREEMEGRTSTPCLEGLAQRIPPDSDPDAQLQWCIEMMGYAYLYGSEALKRGAIYRPHHPQYESATSIYRRFLERVEASMVVEQKAEAAE